MVVGTALAQVGDDLVDEREFRRYEAQIQPQHRSLAHGVEKHREHLMSLIDIKLMAREAYERGLDKNPEWIKAVDLARHKAMVEAYIREQVGLQIEISEDELRANFAAHPARHSVRGAHILLDSRARADSIYAEIEAGRATFEDMARKHSLDAATAAAGGWFDSYYAFDRVSDRVYERVFALDIGEVSQPFRTPQGWEIAKVVDRKLVPFEKYRTVIQRATFLEKIENLRSEHIDKLVVESGLRPVGEQVRRFVAAWNEQPGSPQLTPEEWAAPLYEYDGGVITVQQGSYLLHNTRLGRAQIDSALLDDRIRRRGAPDLLLGLAAERGGYGERSEVQEKVEAEKERLLLQRLWEELLENALAVSEEEARAHYEAHPEMYWAPEEIVVQEIMVADESLAQELMEQIRNGADMAALATKYSIRRNADENGGLYALRAFEKIVYKELMDAAVSAPERELQGPIELVNPLPSSLNEFRSLERAFSIFRVLQRRPKRVEEYDLSQQKAHYLARQAKQQRELRTLNLQLRDKWHTAWGINDDALVQYALAADKKKTAPLP
ncbi:MAG: peptidylprolyl isomerase [Gemmatimonadota bacterium]|nr:peptidylprolyl isomerase [Gemmatimonadota bacterium]